MLHVHLSFEAFGYSLQIDIHRHTVVVIVTDQSVTPKTSSMPYSDEHDPVLSAAQTQIPRAGAVLYALEDLPPTNQIRYSAWCCHIPHTRRLHHFTTVHLFARVLEVANT